MRLAELSLEQLLPPIYGYVYAAFMPTDLSYFCCKVCAGLCSFDCGSVRGFVLLAIVKKCVKRYLAFDESTLAVMCRIAVLKPCATTAFLEYRMTTSAALLPAGHAEDSVAPDDLAVRLVGVSCRQVLLYGRRYAAYRLFSSSPTACFMPPKFRYEYK